MLEDLPKPGSKHGLPGQLGWGPLTLRRVLGTVPVEPDGSASFEVPALRAVYFVALDEKGPGGQTDAELYDGDARRSPRVRGLPRAPHGDITPNNGYDTLQALKRPPSRIEPVSGVPEVFDYPRDIQPIWDRHCVCLPQLREA